MANEMNKNYLKSVSEQYEKYPYPKRDPEEEKTRILATALDDLKIINHYGFNGKIPIFKKNKGQQFRVLVAGGGTGDASTFLAAQLEDFNAKIIYLDISEASLENAKKRAHIRNLKNIEFVHGSILDLPEMDFEPFHYINSCGVLHHLESPTEGLIALKSVLLNDGVMGLMVYGKYGRAEIYQTQDIMRLINGNEKNMQQKVDNTKSLLGILPQTNGYKKNENRWAAELSKHGDIAIYDLFLHSQDRSYDIPELYHWVEDEAGLHIVEFRGIGDECNKMSYMPQFLIPDDKLLARISKLPKIEQQSVAELFVGSMRKHAFYASKSANSIATIDNLDLVPYLNISLTGDELANLIENNPGSPIKIEDKNIGFVTIMPTENLSRIFRQLDGKKSLSEIFNSVNEDIDTRIEDIVEEFATMYNKLFLLDFILLKSKGSPEFMTPQTIQTELNKRFRQSS